MIKMSSAVLFAAIIILAGSALVFASPGSQQDQGTTKRPAIELAQLNIFDDPAIDKRIAEAQRKIDVGIKRGQLTQDEAYKLQATLDKIKEKVAKYRADGFLTPHERSQTNEMLVNLEERIRTERRDEDVAQMDSTRRRILELQKKIDDGVRAGQLTRDEAGQLQAALNRIKEKDANFRADNVLSDDEKFRLTQMISVLEERIRYERQDNDVVHKEAFGRRLAELKRKIEVGMRAGQLNLDEACRLNEILIRIKERDAKFRADGVLTREERARLNRMLIHLEERIYEERWDADINNSVFR